MDGRTQTNLQVVESLYSAFGRGDVPSLLNLLHDDIDWHFVGLPEHVPHGGHFHNKEQVLVFFGTVAQTAQVLEFGPTEMSAFDDKVVSLGHERVIATATGKEFETDWIHYFTIRDGKVIRVREFYDTARMAAAYKG